MLRSAVVGNIVDVCVMCWIVGSMLVRMDGIICIHGRQARVFIIRGCPSSDYDTDVHINTLSTFRRGPARPIYPHTYDRSTQQGKRTN